MIKYLNFLEKYKKLVGLSDYKIFLLEKIENSSNIAEATVDIFEKFIKVNLYKGFIEGTKEFKKETLMHELVHARLCIALQEQQQATKYIEENFVNDITRGLKDSYEHRRPIYREPRKKSRKSI